MKNKIILIIISIIFICSINVSAENIELKDTDNYWELIELIDNYTSKRDLAHELAEEARNKGYEENCAIISNTQGQWIFYNEIVKFYQNQLNEVNKELDKLEYKDATLIWEYMKNLGWNDYVCAGILGNMMAEVGGGTLNLQTTVSGNGFYGICQWAQMYSQDVWNKDLKGQLEYLKNDIQYQFDTYGFCYSYNFNFEQFLKLNDEKEAAMAFATCYERCLISYRYIRQEYATIAYEYFTK